MGLSLDQKWELVKEFYESYYGRALQRQGSLFKFKFRLANHKIEYLYDQMVKVQRELKDFYFHNPWVIHRMRQVKTEPRLILKRGFLE
jgi:hypothetical protein